MSKINQHMILEFLMEKAHSDAEADCIMMVSPEEAEKHMIPGTSGKIPEDMTSKALYDETYCRVIRSAIKSLETLLGDTK